MREWQMTDDQFRAQSYKNMQIRKRKRRAPTTFPTKTFRKHSNSTKLLQKASYQRFKLSSKPPSKSPNYPSCSFSRKLLPQFKIPALQISSNHPSRPSISPFLFKPNSSLFPHCFFIFLICGWKPNFWLTYSIYFILRFLITVSYQNETASHFGFVLLDGHDPLTQILARRPFYVWWFMNQLAMCVLFLSSRLRLSLI